MRARVLGSRFSVLGGLGRGELRTENRELLTGTIRTMNVQTRMPRRPTTGSSVRKAMVRNDFCRGEILRLPSQPSMRKTIFAQTGGRGTLRRPHETAIPPRGRFRIPRHHKTYHETIHIYRVSFYARVRAGGRPDGASDQRSRQPHHHGRGERSAQCGRAGWRRGVTERGSGRRRVSASPGRRRVGLCRGRERLSLAGRAVRDRRDAASRLVVHAEHALPRYR